MEGHAKGGHRRLQDQQPGRQQPGPLGVDPEPRPTSAAGALVRKAERSPQTAGVEHRSDEAASEVALPPAATAVAGCGTSSASSSAAISRPRAVEVLWRRRIGARPRAAQDGRAQRALRPTSGLGRTPRHHEL